MHLYNFSPTIIHKLGLNINKNEYYIKRDDLLPLSFGGNKARKAELFFKDIESKGADCVVTYGSSRSNHCRIISNVAASKGIPCYIISPQENAKKTNNSKMIELFGANMVYCSVNDVSATIENKLQELKSYGLKPYFIEGGGHGNIGTQAYLDCYNEIKQQEKQMGLYFDYIFHASGTGTTQAGLVCGLIKNNDKRYIVGISCARKKPNGEKAVVDSVREYLKADNFSNGTLDTHMIEKHVNFIDDYILNSYGAFNKEILYTIRETIINEGIPLDIAYTGKAFWGMKDYIIENNIKGKNILFIHTGGTPLFFDDLEDIANG